MKRPQAIIFDLDDTLYPEQAYVRSGFRAVAAWAAEQFKLSADVVFEELISLQATNSGRVFDGWLASRDLDLECVQKMVDVYRRHVPDIEPFPGTRELLHRLKDEFRIGLLSDGYLLVQRNKFAALNIAPYFDAVVFSDEFGRSHWKPDSKPYDAVLRRLGGLASSNAVYVGDNPTKDFVGARRAGIASIRIRRADGVYAGLVAESQEYAADETIGDLGELVSVFD